MRSAVHNQSASILHFPRFSASNEPRGLIKSFDLRGEGEGEGGGERVLEQ